jgi:polyisoprenoid-binding protein YceI
MRISNFTCAPSVILSLVLLFCFQFALSQTYNLDNKTSFLQVNGTSSLHDWHLDAEEQSGLIEFSDLASADISRLKFSVESESLKSGKSSMDKNTFKALNTDKYKTIDFDFKDVKSIEKLNENTYTVALNGNLTVSGVTKQVTIGFKLVIDNNLIKLNGEKSILMTDFGIDPPKALLGTIKTGNEITIAFKPVFTTKK